MGPLPNAFDAAHPAMHRQAELNDRRRDVAEAAYEAFDFPLPVEAANGWTSLTPGVVWHRTVFLTKGQSFADGGGASTLRVEFAVRFTDPRSAEVADCSLENAL